MAKKLNIRIYNTFGHHNFLLNYEALQKIPLYSHVIYSKSCVDNCKRLYVIVCFRKPLVEVDSTPSIWSRTIFILEITCLKTFSYYVIEDHGNVCVSYHWLVCNYDNNFWLVDVKVKLWHLYFGCQFH